MRWGPLLPLSLACALCLGSASSPADSADGAQRDIFDAKGNLVARWSYIGSSSSSTDYSALRISGSLGVSALSDRVALRFRSHHWLHFQRTERHVLESAFENRSILHTASIVTDGLLLPGLQTEAGRFFPELEYGSSPPIDGGSIGYERRGFAAGIAGGRCVDVWNGRADDPLGLARLRYRTRRFTAAAGFQLRKRGEVHQRELPAGLSLHLEGGLRIEAYGAYDFAFDEIARAGGSVSWQRSRSSIALSATRWRNPFDQLVLLDRGTSLSDGNLSAPPVPASFDDIRASGSLARGRWRGRGALGLMRGARSGWTANACVTAPPMLGFLVSLGGQGMHSDFIDLYSLDAAIERRVGEASLRIETQTRNYEWASRPSRLHLTDNYSLISADYPLRRHLSLGLEAGGFFRTIGDERFKPQVSVRLSTRL